MKEKTETFAEYLAATRSLTGPEVQEELYEGFPIRVLERAFARVCNTQDWKAPIDTILPKVETETAKAAIKYFTGQRAAVFEDATGRTCIQSAGARVARLPEEDTPAHVIEHMRADAIDLLSALQWLLYHAERTSETGRAELKRHAGTLYDVYDSVQHIANDNGYYIPSEGNPAPC